MVSKILHMVDIKWPKPSRNIAMIKFGVIFKIPYHRYEIPFLYPIHLSYIILIKD